MSIEEFSFTSYWLLRVSRHYLQPTTGTLHTIVNFQYYEWLEQNHNMYDIASAMRKLHAYLIFFSREYILALKAIHVCNEIKNS